MADKVYGGTLKDQNLCTRCRYGFVTTDRGSTQRIYCNYIQRAVRTDVVECNKFSSADTPALYVMEEIAWRVVGDKQKGKVGFVGPEEWKTMAKTHQPRPS